MANYDLIDLGITVTGITHGQYQINLPSGTSLVQAGDQVAILKGDTVEGYLLPKRAASASTPIALELNGAVVTDPVAVHLNLPAWSTGFEYYLPVVYFNKSETH